MAALSFVFFLVVFAAIGLLSTRRAQTSDSDYLLAGQSVPPALVSLSAAATKYSGYMFIGLMGYIYSFGLSAIWLGAGFLFGDLIVFSFVHRRLRTAAAETGALSFADLISRWHGGDYRLLRLVIGLVNLIFLSTYAAAQLNAGGKALFVLFGWPYATGAMVGAGVILLYCFSGGLRASIWTDAGQSGLMMLAMALLLFAAISASGGWSAFTGALNGVSDTYMDLGSERFGGLGAAALFAVGWLFNGIGVTGQPQVMVRFMALDRPEHTFRAGLWYFGWSGLFLILTFMVGLATRLFIPDAAGFDAELALPTLAQGLLPGVGVGIIVGGVFAASMSTADSQILSCAAVLSQDFKLDFGRRSKQIATLLVAISALLIAVFASASVFTLVIVAWSALAASLGPLVIIQALGRRPQQATMLVMMATGLVVALGWRAAGLGARVYEGLPGILSALLVYLLLDPVIRRLGRN